MTRIEKRESQVAALSDDELRAFGEWFDHMRDRLWDLQIAADCVAGKHDAPAAAVVAEFTAGHATPPKRIR